MKHKGLKYPANLVYFSYENAVVDGSNWYEKYDTEFYQDCVDMVLSKMPEDLRSLVRLRFEEGYNLKEIGEKYDMTGEWARLQFLKIRDFMNDTDRKVIVMFGYGIYLFYHELQLIEKYYDMFSFLRLEHAKLPERILDRLHENNIFTLGDLYTIECETQQIKGIGEKKADIITCAVDNVESQVCSYFSNDGGVGEDEFNNAHKTYISLCNEDKIKFGRYFEKNIFGEVYE